MRMQEQEAYRKTLDSILKQVNSLPQGGVILKSITLSNRLETTDGDNGTKVRKEAVHAFAKVQVYLSASNEIF